MMMPVGGRLFEDSTRADDFGIRSAYASAGFFSCGANAMTYSASSHAFSLTTSLKLYCEEGSWWGNCSKTPR